MGKRYRALRKNFRMSIAAGKAILWHGYRYPPKGQPACTDKEIIQAIESKKGFGQQFWEEQDPDEILINPQAVPPDCDAAHLERAAKEIVRLGMHVNPKFLKPEDEEEEAEELSPEEEPPQIPTKTFVNSAKGAELVAMIKKLGWDDIDTSAKVKDMKAAVKAKIEELSPQEE